MRLICIFKGTKLLDKSDFFHPSTAGQFKENVAFQTGNAIEDLDAVMFEDPDMDAYIKTTKYQNTKSYDISKASIKLIDAVEVSVPNQYRLDWKNCDEAQVLANFSVEDQEKIIENKSYYDSLGNEKYQAGFNFEWPHEIEGPLVDGEGTDIDYVTFKTITGQVI